MASRPVLLPAWDQSTDDQLSNLVQGGVMDEECIHGTNSEWCAICNGSTGRVPVPRGMAFTAGETKQDILNDICDELGIPRHAVGVGSSLPSEVFEKAALRGRVPVRSMPEIGEALADAAGLAWGRDCDSRDSLSGGGSTVTADGLRVMLKALRVLR